MSEPTVQINKPWFIAKFTLIDLFVIGVLVAVHGISLLPAVYLGAWLYGLVQQPWIAAVAIPLGYFVYLFAFTAVNGLFKRVLVGKLATGEFRFRDPEARRWRFHMLFATAGASFCMANVKVLAALKFLHYRFLGGRINFLTVNAVNADIYEPELVSMGDRSVTGMGAIVSGHVTAGDVVNLALGPVKIGEACIIGGTTVIMPGTEIADGVVIGTGAVIGRDVRMGPRSMLLNNGCLPDGAVVGAGEIWGGVPARKIKDREP